MISLCTVYLTGIEEYVDLLARSVVERTSEIRQVLMAKSDAEPSFYEEHMVGNVRFVRFGSLHLSTLGARYQQSIEHALSLHACLERADQEYVLFADPDTFFYEGTDKFYLDMLARYELDMVGVSHNSAINHAFTFFPYVYSSLISRNKLPGPDFLSGKLWARNGYFRPSDKRVDGIPDERLDGKYLIPAPILEHIHEFPNPDGLYDTGCNMHLWFKQTGGRWISFQTADCHIYTTQYFRANFKMKERMPRRNIVYHNVGGSNCRADDLRRFQEAYCA